MHLKAADEESEGAHQHAIDASGVDATLHRSPQYSLAATALGGDCRRLRGGGHEHEKGELELWANVLPPNCPSKLRKVKI